MEFSWETFQVSNKLNNRMISISHFFSMFLTSKFFYSLFKNFVIFIVKVEWRAGFT
jgi:hypothetical protein